MSGNHFGDFLLGIINSDSTEINCSTEDCLIGFSPNVMPTGRIVYHTRCDTTTGCYGNVYCSVVSSGNGWHSLDEIGCKDGAAPKTS